MKSKLFLTALAAAVFSLGSFAGTGTMNIDQANSSIFWKAKKVGGAHEGYISLAEGSLSFEDGALAGGSFVVDMTSISVTDIADEKMNGKLVGHLNSPDFFNTAEHSKASFSITSAEATGDATYKVVGDLTIKGITAPVEFEAVMSEADGKMVADAEIVVDRTLYDVRYGSKKFFDNLGDKFIYDNFTLEVKLVEGTAKTHDHDGHDHHDHEGHNH
jgi:polyisoprenoid-binding protein YceI